MYRVLDLFAGAGGMSLGFQQTGRYYIATAVEKNPYAKQSYKLNHKDAAVIDDILEIADYDAFQQQYGRFDIVVGGPPCQGFSNANRQKNHIISQNNSLVKKYVEVIEHLKPKAFVMENVRMLKSDTHRFYLSKSDKDDIERLCINLRKETLCLYAGRCPVDDIEEYIINPEIVSGLILPDKALNILRILLKSSYKNTNRSKVLEKKGTECIKIINSLADRQSGALMRCIDSQRSDCIKGVVSSREWRAAKITCYTQFEKQALAAYIKYITGEINFEEAEPIMAALINIQKLLKSVQELYSNNIIINCLRIEDAGIYADVQSFSVIDYINKKLGQYYRINANILNAAWFGVPQLRERYIAVGIREDLAEKNNIMPKLPEAIFIPEEYRTVSDAIKDLEQITPVYNVNEAGMSLESFTYDETPLTKYLRDSALLSNHVATETSDIALKRFESLKPGQNFHDLNKDLIKDTYSQPERTQNSIYLRLKYDKPSGTVTNVRKAMWIHPTLNRAISIREAARLQTFPDSFVFIGSKDSQYQQVGNAVPPIMAKAIAEKLAEQLESCSESNSESEMRHNGLLYSGTTSSSDVQNPIEEHSARNDCQEISA